MADLVLEDLEALGDLVLFLDQAGKLPVKHLHVHLLVPTFGIRLRSVTKR